MTKRQTSRRSKLGTLAASELPASPSKQAHGASLRAAKLAARRLTALLLPEPRQNLDVDSMAMLANAAAEGRDARLALEHVQAARKLAPTSLDLMDIEAWALSELGQTLAALELYGEMHNQGDAGAACDAARVAAEAGLVDWTAHFFLLAIDAAPSEALCLATDMAEDDVPLQAREAFRAVVEMPAIRATLNRPHRGPAVGEGD